MKKIMPVLLILFGLGGGIGAGVMMKPVPELPEKGDAKDGAEIATNIDDGSSDEPILDPVVVAEDDVPVEIVERSYVTIGKQMIIPVVDNHRTLSLIHI